MNTFHLQIVTPDGLLFDGEAQKTVVRAVMGDVCILSGHAAYVTPLSSGEAKVTFEDGSEKTAYCEGGLLSVKKNVTRIVSDEFKWNEE